MKRILLVGLLAGVTACASGPPTRNAELHEALYDGRSTVTFGTLLPVESSQEAERRGDAALQEGDSDRALFEYIRALEFELENATVLHKIGQLHAERGNRAAGETAFRWALAAENGHAGAHEGLGLILLEQREYKEAAKHLRVAVKQNPRAWRAHNALGIIADLEENHAQAKAHYEAALALRPRSAQLLNNLGYSRYLAGDWGGALDAFRAAVSQDAGFQLAWRNLGLLHARRGEYGRAVDAFERTMDRASAYNNLGYVSMHDGRYDLARSYFEKAIRASPRYYAAAHNNLSRLEALRAGE